MRVIISLKFSIKRKLTENYFMLKNYFSNIAKLFVI